MEYGLGGIVNSSAVLREADALGEGIRVMRVDHLSNPAPPRKDGWPVPPRLPPYKEVSYLVKPYEVYGVN